MYSVPEAEMTQSIVSEVSHLVSHSRALQLPSHGPLQPRHSPTAPCPCHGQLPTTSTALHACNTLPATLSDTLSTATLPPPQWKALLGYLGEYGGICLSQRAAITANGEMYSNLSLAQHTHGRLLPAYLARQLKTKHQLLPLLPGQPFPPKTFPHIFPSHPTPLPHHPLLSSPLQHGVLVIFFHPLSPSIFAP